MRRLLVFVWAVTALMGLLASNTAAHSVDLDCGDFASQTGAQNHRDLHPGDPDGLDEDNDGVGCPELPCPCGATVLPPSTPIPVRSPPAAPPPPLATDARVVGVIDANTLTVRLPAGETVDVRLIGIDAPKRRGPGARADCGALDATAHMKRLALRNGIGRSVRLRTDPTHAPDDGLGRRLAYVDARGVDFGRTLISSGWAQVDAFDGDFLRANIYRKAQASAKAAQRGAWRRCSGAAAAR